MKELGSFLWMLIYDYLLFHCIQFHVLGNSMV